MICPARVAPSDTYFLSWPTAFSFTVMAALLLTSVFLSFSNQFSCLQHFFPLLHLLLVVSEISPHLPFYWVVRCKILLLHHSSHFHLPLHFRSSSSYFFLQAASSYFSTFADWFLERIEGQYCNPSVFRSVSDPQVVQYSQKLLRSIIQGRRRNLTESVTWNAWRAWNWKGSCHVLTYTFR